MFSLFLLILSLTASSLGEGLSSVGGSYCFDKDGKDHSAGEQYSPDGCNTCTCMEVDRELKGKCTKMYCGNPIIRKPEEEANKCIDNEGKIRKVGDKYTHVDGCNSCTCMSFGGVCTRMFCLPFNKNKKCRDNEGNERDEDDKWTEGGCKKCVCGPFGAVCTEKCYNEKKIQLKKVGGDHSCKDHNDQSKMPGDQWLSGDNCNICICIGDGSDPACTKMACGARLAKLKSANPLNGGGNGVGSIKVNMTMMSLVVCIILAGILYH